MIPSGVFGRVTEWSIVAVSKTVVRVSVPGVRIPPRPPVICFYQSRFVSSYLLSSSNFSV